MNEPSPNTEPAHLAPLAARLERGEAVTPALDALWNPSAWFNSEDRKYLSSEAPAQLTLRDITLLTSEDEISPRLIPDSLERRRMTTILQSFREASTAAVRAVLPEYGERIESREVMLRPHEEAVRSWRHTFRRDMLHIDGFDELTSGRRVLRLTYNLNPNDPRVWRLSQNFAEILEWYSLRRSVPQMSIEEWRRDAGGRLRLWGAEPSTAYDQFMKKIRAAMIESESYQELAPTRLRMFAPGEAWLYFPDANSHAVLRGRMALQHDFLAPHEAMIFPEQAPLSILSRASGMERKSA